MEAEKRKPLITLLLPVGIAAVLLTPMAVYVLLRSHEGGPGLRGEPPPAASTGKTAQPKPVIPVLDSEPPKRSAPRAPAGPVGAAKPAPPPARKFPSPKDIPVGVDKSWLLASYGRPNMVTTEVTEGRPMETFRYLRPESGTEVVVYLRSGRVVGASSSVY